MDPQQTVRLQRLLTLGLFLALLLAIVLTLLSFLRLLVA
jgi:hypothetical protein